MAAPAAQPPPTYTANSPPTARLSPYSPTSRSHHQLAYSTQYSSRPTTSTPSALPLSSGINQSPRHGPAPSPTANGLSHINTSIYPPRESSNSTYYDPTSEHREGTTLWGHSHSSTRSPRQVCTIDASKSHPIVIEIFAERNPEPRHEFLHRKLWGAKTTEKRASLAGCPTLLSAIAHIYGFTCTSPQSTHFRLTFSSTELSGAGGVSAR